MSLRPSIVGLLTLCSLLAPGPVATADGTPTKRELACLKRVEREVLKLAKKAARGKAYAEAIAELELGLEIWSGSKRLATELKRVRKKARKGGLKAWKDFLAKFAATRKAAHAKVAMALADAALAVEKEHPDRYGRYVALIQGHYPAKRALDKLDVAYFAPYFKWVSRTHNSKLESGWELHEGKWLDPKTVTSLDASHADWSDPWRISDAIHEVRTTLPYRRARQILEYVGHYRRYFLRRFGKLWDLQTPTGKLPVIVTRTQAEMRAEMNKITGTLGGDAGNGAAFYVQTNGKLDPCFVTFEPKTADGSTSKLERFDQVLVALTHEITHQICFEYSKHAYVRTRGIEHQFWCVEGIANHLGYYVFDGRTWRLTKPQRVPMGAGYTEGPFFWCQKNKARLPAISTFVGVSHAQFMTAENYHIAATLSYFLVAGEGGKYLEPYVKLLQAVHRVKDTRELFDRCFAGIDLGAMQGEWIRFIEAIQLDDE